MVDDLGPLRIDLTRPGDEVPWRLSRRRFRRHWTSIAVMSLASRRATPDEPGVSAATPLRAAFARRRGVLIESLVGSLLLQGLSLSSPIAFLLVIDKVIDHRGINTLDVILAALVVIAVFEALTAGLRTHLLGRAATGIDVEVIAKLFRHLTELPLDYFVSTPLGGLLGRFADADKLRGYVVQAAVGSLADLMFASLFLALLFYLSAKMAWIVLAALLLQWLAALAAIPLQRAALLWHGAHLVIAQAMTLGQLIAFNLIAMRVSAPVMRLARYWLELQGARLAYGNLKSLFSVEAESDSRRPPMPAVQGDIEFDRVSFSYTPEGPYVLNGSSFCIRAGEVVALVGPSGTGKSTVGRLMAGLHPPGQGKVMIDGIDTSAVEPATLRSQIGLVSQDCFLFARSVRENIAASDPTMAFERILRSAQLAGAHDFIVKLPQGYDTPVGERGATLSGGQRQRLALARALAGRSTILILDEATSAVDRESERDIAARFGEIARGRTVVIIGHRGLLMEQADLVLALEGGRIRPVPGTVPAPVPGPGTGEDAS